MRDNSGIIRLNPNGPAGLTHVSIDPAEFDTPPEAQTLHVYFSDADFADAVRANISENLSDERVI